VGLNDFAGAIPDLERVVSSDHKYDYYRAEATLANAYAQTGDYVRADVMYAEPVQFSTTPEILYNYATFLKLAGRKDEAKQWAQTLMAEEADAASLHAEI